MRIPGMMIVIVAAVLCSAAGCISYTTLQTPDTLPPGKVALGMGASYGGAQAYTIELGGRLGIVKNFDVGFKYCASNLFFFDGKLQLLDAPLTVSADLGFSFIESFNSHDNLNHSRSNAFYPMILVGQRHWYAGIKETYLSTTGTFNVLGKFNYNGSGWLGPTVVLGGWLGNDDIRFLGEANIVLFSGGTDVVPAIGLQFRL